MFQAVTAYICIFVEYLWPSSLPVQIEAKQKYAKWKAVEIDRCLKNGIPPTPGPPGEATAELADDAEGHIIPKPSPKPRQNPTPGVPAGQTQYPTPGVPPYPMPGLPTGQPQYPMPGLPTDQPQYPMPDDQPQYPALGIPAGQPQSTMPGVPAAKPQYPTLGEPTGQPQYPVAGVPAAR